MDAASDSSSQSGLTPTPAAMENVAQLGRFGLPHVLYPNEYVWFLLFSSMDVMLTWVILSLGGSEVNPIAARVIDWWGLPGAIAFKFTLTLLVVVLCEVIGRHKRQGVAKLLAQFAVVISATPVMYSMLLLAIHIARL